MAGRSRGGAIALEGLREIQKNLEDRKVGVGLHRKADQVADLLKRFLKDLEVTLQGSKAVAVERGAYLAGNPVQRHAFAVKRSIPVFKCMHVLSTSLRRVAPGYDRSAQGFSAAPEPATGAAGTGSAAPAKQEEAEDPMEAVRRALKDDAKK